MVFITFGFPDVRAIGGCMRFVPVPLKYDFEEVLLAQFCTSDMARTFAPALMANVSWFYRKCSKTL